MVIPSMVILETKILEMLVVETGVLLETVTIVDNDQMAMKNLNLVHAF